MSLNPLEIKAAKALFPYFSKYPTVLDVGSNKGLWTDILVHNVSNMYLVEPNEMLLSYTAAKYDHLKHVFYSKKGISKSDGMIEFQFFTDQHNGLSNIVSNPRWGVLMPNRKVIETESIDTFFLADVYIDLLKIDIEGAEWLALQGAEKSLKEKRIKFIQIEKSEHYNFTPVPDFVRQFGYDVFHFDGLNFVKWTGQEAENLYIMDAEFTQDWNREFIANTEFLKGKVKFALEIGCFEGLTSRYICDNLLIQGPYCDDACNISYSRMICIDPLTDEYLPGHPDNHLFVGQYDRFIRNTRAYPIELLRMTSREAFNSKGFSDYRFDFIYIDGDHRRNEVYLDGCKAFELCRPGGHILFDDYLWRDETKEGIDKFLKEHENLYAMVVNGYQIMIKKLRNKE